jgi:L-ectoine synthase
MIHRTFDQVKGTSNFVEADGFVSARLAVADDNLGFTVTEAIGSSDIDLEVEHKNHIEAVYVLEGTGTIEIVDTGEIYKIEPGVFYAFDQHERHRYHLDTVVRAIAIFNPPLVGDEVNDESGGYATSEEPSDAS